MFLSQKSPVFHHFHDSQPKNRGLFRESLGASGSMAAQSAAMNTFSSGMSAIAQNYILTMAPSLEKLDQAAVEVGGRTVQIEVSDQSKLREVLKSLYAETVARERL